MEARLETKYNMNIQTKLAGIFFVRLTFLPAIDFREHVYNRSRNRTYVSVVTSFARIHGGQRKMFATEAILILSLTIVIGGVHVDRHLPVHSIPLNFTRQISKSST